MGERGPAGATSGNLPLPSLTRGGARGHHGARPGQGENNGGQQENTGGVTLGVWGNGRGREASGVDHESPGVEDKEGGRKASGVAENPRGGAREWAGESSCLRETIAPEWPMNPGGTKPPYGPQRLRADRGRTDGGGGEGAKNHPPHEQPGQRETTGVTAQQWAGSGRRRQRAR